MIKKRSFDINYLNGIFGRVCDFAKMQSRPTHYSRCKSPEPEMQLEFSKFLSNDYDVLREVSIPAICQLKSCGKDTWELDESIRLEAINKSLFYVIGELKFHGKSMVGRDFKQETEDDFTRMFCTSRDYAEVVMAFTLFITYDEKERNELYKFANGKEGVEVVKLDTTEENYYGIAIKIFPTNKESKYGYSGQWNTHFQNLKTAENLKDNYFPCIRRW